MSGERSKKLRFGVMTDGTVLKLWQVNAIRRLTSKGHDFVLVIENIEGWQGGNDPLLKKYLGKNALYNLYVRFIQNVENLRNTDFSDELEKVEVIKVKTEKRGKYSRYFKSADVQKIKEKNLDFILRFGFNIIKGEILNAARFGVWSFHHADEQVIRGGPPGLWEILNNHKINGIILQRLTETLDGGLIIRKGFFPVIRHSYSAHLNELLSYGVDMLEFAVENVLADIPFVKVDNKHVKVFRFPCNIQMIIFFIKLIFNRIKFNLKDLFLQENWNIGIIDKPVAEVIDSGRAGDVVFAPENKKTKFRADVFGLRSGDNLQLFYEDFDYTTYKGVISSAGYNLNTRHFNFHGSLLTENYHLAFPFVFDDSGNIYLIPESSVSGGLTVYKFSDDLKFAGKQQIAAIDCVDSVIFRYNDLYWLFCTRRRYGTNINLFVYYSDNIFGEWKSHGLNPVVSDARLARMAGNMFYYNGNLVRPAQKNNIFYGEAVKLMQIDKLSPTEYSEKPLTEIRAKDFAPYNKGVHTFSVIDDVVAVDAKNYKFVGTEFFRKLKTKLNR